MKRPAEPNGADKAAAAFGLDPKLFSMILCGAGIMLAFIAYGVLQERIMSIPFGANEAEGIEGERFGYSAFLVLNNRLVALAVAIVMLLYRKESMQPVAPIYKYFGISVSNTAATICQYEALKYVTFPTQTLGKCGKMIPVMILGTVISGKKYFAKDYAQAVLVTLGCTIFLLTGDISSKHADEDKENSLWGLMLMGGYVFCDGFTSTFQEKLFRGYTMSTYNQMLYVNMASGTIAVITLMLQGNFLPAIDFCSRHPSFLLFATFLSLAASSGQVIIYHTIKEHGALFFSAVMTTRQVAQIVMSCIIFVHPLSAGQWVGIGLVFATLYYKTVSRKKSTKTAAPKPSEAVIPPPEDTSNAIPMETLGKPTQIGRAHV